MTDTTHTQLIFNSLDSVQVSIIKHSLDSLTTTIFQTQSKPDNSGWLSFFSALAGGALVICGQLFIEYFKTNHEKKKDLSNVLSEIVRQRGLLRNFYRELAMYKTHAEYWWYCTIIENDPPTAEQHRQEHLKSQSEFRKTERDIGETIATFLGLVAKFETTLGRTVDLSASINNISNLKTRPANSYVKEQDYNDVRNRIVIEDELKLKEEYFQNLNEFDNIINILKELGAKAATNSG